MADQTFNRFKMGGMSSDYDLKESGNNVKLALVSAAYARDIRLHQDFADITNELSGTGYTAGGEALTNQTVTQDNVDDEGVFDADDITFIGFDAGTAAAGIYYADSGVAATSLLIGIIDSGGFPKPGNGGDLVIQIAAEGIININ